MKARAVIDPGICGFKGEVFASSKKQMGLVDIEIKTECPNLKKMDSRYELNAFNITKDGCDTEVFKKVQEISPPMCCPCPYLNAVYFVAKIASGLALPKDIVINLTKEE